MLVSVMQSFCLNIPFLSLLQIPFSSLLHTFSSPLSFSSFPCVLHSFHPSTSSLPLFCRPFTCSCQPVCLNRLNPLAASISFSHSFTHSSVPIDIQILQFPFRMPNSIQFPLLLLLSLVPVILCQESIVPAVRVVRLQIDYENADVSSVQKINK